MAEENKPQDVSIPENAVDIVKLIEVLRKQLPTDTSSLEGKCNQKVCLYLVRDFHYIDARQYAGEALNVIRSFHLPPSERAWLESIFYVNCPGLGRFNTELQELKASKYGPSRRIRVGLHTDHPQDIV